MVGSPPVFDRDRLRAVARARRDDYRAAAPFPHAVIDGILPDPLLDEVCAEFPPPDAQWRHFDDPKQRKFGAGPDVDLGPATRHVLAEFNAPVFVEFVQALTGIEEALVADPQYRGGGLHQILPGGYLEVHADFNQHPDTGLDRRVNVLLYLNRDWRPEWGGQLELWNATMTRAEHRIDPEFNRMVIFTITDHAFHGHPEPLRCPEGRTRRSLAFYYYSAGRPDLERSAPHSTLWQERP
jgi:hypothetical protein